MRPDERFDENNASDNETQRRRGTKKKKWGAASKSGQVASRLVCAGILEKELNDM